MPSWLNNFLSGLDPREMLILNRLFLDNENTRELTKRIADETPREGEELLIDAEAEDELKTIILEREAQKIQGPITEADKAEIAAKVDVSVDDARIAALGTEEQQAVGIEARQIGLPDPSGSTTWLVNDAYLSASMDPVTFSFTTNVLPYGKGTSGQFMRGSQDFPGMLGTTDIQFYAARPMVEGGGRGAMETPAPTQLSWTYDQRKLPNNYEFISVRETDVPFTVSDAMGIYDKQDEQGKRLIAQGLALGDRANGSYTFKVLKNEMFTNPEAIYDRDVVEAAIMEMSAAASTRARFLDKGFADLGDRFNPTTVLDNPDSLGSFQDDLFDMAVDANLVTQITADYGRELAERALSNITGLQDFSGFSELVETWTSDIQQENMGRSLSAAEIQAGFETRIENEPMLEGAIQASNKLVAQQALGRAIKRANARTA